MGRKSLLILPLTLGLGVTPAWAVTNLAITDIAPGGSIIGGITGGGTEFEEDNQRLIVEVAVSGTDFGDSACPSGVSEAQFQDMTLEFTATNSSGDTATVGADYTGLPQTVNDTLTSASTLTFGLDLLDDNEIEGDESFTVRLTNPSGEVRCLGFSGEETELVTRPVTFNVGPGSTVTIADNDDFPNGVINTPPGDVTIDVGESVNFSGTGTDPDGDLPLSFSWDFGGGATNSTLQNPGEVTFDTPGTFTVTFTVTDSTGLTDPTPDTRTVTVVDTEGQLPNGTIDSPASDVTINAGESVNFAGTGTGLEPISFQWDFGGGATNVTVEDPGEVIFPTPGTFTVTLTVSDAQGRQDPTPPTVMIKVEEADDGSPIAGLLQQFARTPGQKSVANTIEIVCPKGIVSADLQRDCDAVVGGAFNEDPGTGVAIAQVTVDEAGVPLDAALSSTGAQTQNIGTRLAALRGGATGFNIERLAFTFDGAYLSGDHLTRLYQAMKGETGGAASSDATFSRWGGFVSGTINTGDKDETENEAGFDFDTWGITAGMDYRFSDRVIVGGAFGYLNTDTDLNANGGQLDVDGYTLTLYGTYYQSDRFYLDASLGYGWNDYDQERNLEYNLSTQNVTVDQQFFANYDGSQFVITFGGGYEFNRDALTFGPVGQLQYVDAEVDGYQETAGNPDADGSGWIVELDDQDYDSLTLSLGGQLSYAMSRSWGVLVPQARFEWVHEFDEEGRLITGRFIGDPSGEAFGLPTDETDSNYFNLGLGVSAVFARGRSAFFNYQGLLGFDDLNSHLFNAGVRWEF